MPASPPNTVRIDRERCEKCGGKCCRIYLPEAKGGLLPNTRYVLFGLNGFEEWAESFHQREELYGVAPIFNLFENGNWNIPEDGSCQYRGPSGCIIPLGRRPAQCTSFRCQDWINEEERAKEAPAR